MSTVKKLAGDTVIYGISTVLGRLLNWLLTPFYIKVFTDMVDFGVVVNLYSYIAVILILLTFGLETGFFRFVNSDNRHRLLWTLFASIFIWSTLFIFGVVYFDYFITTYLGNNIITSDLFLLSILIVSLDALSSILFANLRYLNKSFQYASIRFLQVVVTVFFNVFFLVICPLLQKDYAYLIDWFYNGDNLLIYVFISNLISSIFAFIVLLPHLVSNPFKIDFSLLFKILKYSYPIMFVGLFGMTIQNIDKILIPHLIDNKPLEQLAIYGANFKIGVLMALFIQSFRLAFEPFFFKKGTDQSANDMYAQVLKYFTIFGMIIYVGVLLMVDLVNMLLSEEYLVGNEVIPWVMLGQLFFGIYYSLSFWYKLTDNTRFGAYISFCGMLIVIFLNIWLVPIFGIIGAAISSFSCFLLMALVSYLLGQKYYPVNYSIYSIIGHIVFGVFVVYLTNRYLVGKHFDIIFLKGLIFVGYLLVLGFIERKNIIKIKTS